MTKTYSFIVKRILVALIFVLGGMVPAHGATAYAPFGQFSKQPWQAKCLYQWRNNNDPDEWIKADFDDSSWTTISGPVSTPGALGYSVTDWAGEYGSDSYTRYFRRHFTVATPNQDYYVFYVTHDDGCAAYLNGVQIYREYSNMSPTDYHTLYIPKELVHSGDNLLAVKVDNISDNAFADFGFYAADPISWTSVELAAPGTLGQEVLYKVDVLSDVTYLKVKGTMNDEDWTTLRNMASLKGVDLSEAKATRVPDEQFSDRGDLHIMLLPSGLTEIGNYAFYKTALTAISIPATVTTIGTHAFHGCSMLGSVTFDSGSRLTDLRSEAFRECTTLKSIALPSSLTALSGSVFYDCTQLSSVTLPSALGSIKSYCFYHTPSLHSIDLPATLSSIEDGAFYESGLESVVLPQNLTYLGSSSFHSNPNLKRVVLPITPVLQYDNWTSGYHYTFGNCPAITEVVSLSATPPAIASDPFNGLDRSKVTLVVPAFAVVDYKLDTYWHEFGTIKEGAEPGQLNLAGALSLTNNRRPANKVDVTLREGARLTVGGNAPFEVGTLSFTANIPNNRFGQLQNNTTAMTADHVVSSCFVYANYWYFITPLHDVSVADVTHSNAEASFIFRRYNAQNRAVNGPQGSWQDLTDNTLRAGQGYILQTNREGWISMPATATGKNSALVNSDAITALATYNAPNSADAHWNYIGNPYACYYDIYYMDLAAPITVWDYNSWTYRAYSPIDDDYVLKPMEAFFVQKPNGLSQVLFRSEGRQFDPDVQRVTAARGMMATGRQLFDLRLSDGQLSDVTRVVVNADASASYETGRDAAKFMSTEATVPQLYTIDQQGNLLSINERPDGCAVSLGMLTSRGGTFTLSLSRGHGQLWLHDAVTGQTIDLSQQDYTFNLEQGGSVNHRFTLTVGDLPTGIDATVNGESSRRAVYDLQGRRHDGQLRPGLYISEGKKMMVK